MLFNIFEIKGLCHVDSVIIDERSSKIINYIRTHAENSTLHTYFFSLSLSLYIYIYILHCTLGNYSNLLVVYGLVRATMVTIHVSFPLRSLVGSPSPYFLASLKNHIITSPNSQICWHLKYSPGALLDLFLFTKNLKLRIKNHLGFAVDVCF